MADTRFIVFVGHNTPINTQIFATTCLCSLLIATCSVIIWIRIYFGEFCTSFWPFESTATYLKTFILCLCVYVSDNKQNKTQVISKIHKNTCVYTFITEENVTLLYQINCYLHTTELTWNSCCFILLPDCGIKHNSQSQLHRLLIFASFTQY